MSEDNDAETKSTVFDFRPLRADGPPPFVVRGEFTNRFGDERVALDLPAPWETPEGMDATANDALKSLDWEEVHYSFEDKVTMVEGSPEECWVVDKNALHLVRRAADEHGYGWAEGVERDTTAEENLLAEAIAVMEEGTWNDPESGTRIEVRYEKKSGGGEGSYGGYVRTASDGTDHPRRTTGVSFQRPDGNHNSVKPDGSGRVGLYSSSMHPFMGEVLELEVFES